MANQLENDQTLVAKIEQARLETEQDQSPHAINAWYDETSRKIIIRFDNDAEFAFPVTLVEGLQKATSDQLATVEVTPLAEGLHWELLDVDLSIPHLLNHVYGSKKWMEELSLNTF